MTSSAPILLMTRSSVASDRFVTALPAGVRKRLTICTSPLIEISATCSELDLSDTGSLIFTSGNAVSIVSRLTNRRDLPCHCVGWSTTQAAQAEGWTATFAGETAHDLVATLRRHRPPEPVLHARGYHARGDIAARLTAMNIKTRETVVYDQHLVALSDEARFALSGPSAVIAPLFSPRTARHFADQCRDARNVYVLALSDAVFEPLGNRAFAGSFVSEKPNAAAMSALVENVLDQLCRVEGI